jgi:hypothetical protein
LRSLRQHEARESARCLTPSPARRQGQQHRQPRS